MTTLEQHIEHDDDLELGLRTTCGPEVARPWERRVEKMKA
jgi:hypothetical protein